MDFWRTKIRLRIRLSATANVALVATETNGSCTVVEDVFDLSTSVCDRVRHVAHLHVEQPLEVVDGHAEVWSEGRVVKQCEQ